MDWKSHCCELFRTACRKYSPMNHNRKFNEACKESYISVRPSLQSDVRKCWKQQNHHEEIINVSSITLLLTSLRIATSDGMQPRLLDWKYTERKKWKSITKKPTAVMKCNKCIGIEIYFMFGTPLPWFMERNSAGESLALLTSWSSSCWYYYWTQAQ